MNLYFVVKAIRQTFIVLSVFLLTQCADEDIKPDKSKSNDSSKEGIKAPAENRAPISCSSCTYIIPAGTKTVDGKQIGTKPGDVICFNPAFKYGIITFENIEGTSQNPVTVTNCDGDVTIKTKGSFIVRFNNSKYFRFTGGDVEGRYGIKLTGSESNGLVMGHLSTNFEVDHIEVYKVGFAGIMAKTDPTCDDVTIRENFTMRDVSFHHNYIHDTHGEGFYIGHSSYGGKELSCGMRMPHTIENIKVYKNIVRNSGWDAIQVSSATKGAAIFDNVVENYATQNKPAQSSGICIGGGTGGSCYNNLIKKGNGPGIAVFGLADNTIHNNVIIDAGTVGIFADERTEPGAGYRFIHNTIINPKEQGMLIYANEVPVNLVVNNIIVNPGYYNKAGNDAYVARLGASVKLDMSNNYFTQKITDLKFVDAVESDFRLINTSPVIDKGRDVSKYKLTNDFYGESRLKGSSYDIGATEY